jgi:4-hydroxy-3-polyprenylbenzoate decarboxylase
MREIIVGVTGASGAICARELIRSLATLSEVAKVHVVLSRFASQSVRAELEVPGEEGAIRKALAGEPSARVVFHAPDNMAAPISSGTYPIAGMAVVPCSVSTLGAIASGYNDNLIHRAADVTLKERRPLVLAIREAPLSRIHLRNMMTLADAGATILPLVPAFYTRPRSVSEIVEQFTARILDQLGLDHALGKRWGA